MVDSDMSRIEKSVRIGAPRARVWRALTSAPEFGAWFGVEVKGAFQPGVRVNMECTNEGYRGVKFYVDVQEMVPERKFSWRWHPGLPDEGVDYTREPATLVEFTLEDADGGTLLKVVESGFDQITLPRRAKVFQSNDGGWAHQVNAIANYVGATAAR